MSGKGFRKILENTCKNSNSGNFWEGQRGPGLRTNKYLLCSNFCEPLYKQFLFMYTSMIFILINVEIDSKTTDISTPMQSAVTGVLNAWQANLVIRHTLGRYCLQKLSGWQGGSRSNTAWDKFLRVVEKCSRSYGRGRGRVSQYFRKWGSIYGNQGKAKLGMGWENFRFKGAEVGAPGVC